MTYVQIGSSARSLATVDHTALQDGWLGSQATRRSSTQSTLFSFIRTLAKASKFRGPNGEPMETDAAPRPSDSQLQKIAARWLVGRHQPTSRDAPAVLLSSGSRGRILPGALVTGLYGSPQAWRGAKKGATWNIVAPTTHATSRRRGRAALHRLWRRGYRHGRCRSLITYWSGRYGRPNAMTWWAVTLFRWSSRRRDRVPGGRRSR